MAKSKIQYVCVECGWESSKWLGQCRQCHTWSSMEEFRPAPLNPALATTVGGAISITPKQSAKAIGEINLEDARFRSSGISELDRVLGGGFVPGAVILLAGEPGVGKSTLLLEAAAAAGGKYPELDQGAPRDKNGSPAPVLYITGEESAAQVRLRAERINATPQRLLLAAETELEAVLGHIQAVKPQLVIIDSVQTIASASVEGQAGGVTQVKAVCQALIGVAKQEAIPILLVGHVTKTGGIAGPRVLEHLVDVVCHFEGERHTRLRLLRAIKNRYGSTEEVGCFELTELGIVGLADPSGLFLSHSQSSIPGTCVSVTLEGRRPMPIEIQALVAPVVSGGNARRTTSGVDYSRLAMTLAVLQARLRMPLSNSDIYVSTVGGAKTIEPSADLAMALAITSAAQNLPVKEKLVAIGEVSLTGEVRASVGVQQRLNEAYRLGFKIAMVPRWGANELKAPEGMEIIPVANLAQAVMEAIPNPEDNPQ